MFKSLSIGKKLSLISIVLSLVFVGISIFVLVQMRSTMIDDRRGKVRALVESAISVADHYSALQENGSLSEEEAKEAAVTAISGMNYDGKNYFFICTTEGILVYHPTRTEQIGQNLMQSDHAGTKRNFTLFVTTALNSPHLEGFSESYGRRPGQKELTSLKLYMSAVDQRWDWVISTGLFIDDIDALFMKRALLILVLAAVGLAIGIGLSFVIGRSITRPLNHTVSALEDLGAGRNDVAVDLDESNTEIGRLSRAFNRFREKSQETEALRQRQAEAEKQAQEQRRRDILGIAEDFERSFAATVQSLAEQAVKMAESSQSMSKNAQESARNSTRVNTAANTAADNVQTVAVASQELGSSIQEIARQIGLAQDVVRKTQSRSGDTQEQISALAQTVGRIGSVVELIDSIAEQTNLLALNATIEAARAGEAGKGFAVVAGEVKALANQTTKATDDIRRQIEVLGQSTTQSVNGVQDVANVIRDLEETTSAIATAIEEQNAATGEIGRNTEVTSKEMKSITQAIQSVTSSVDSTMSTAEIVSKASSDVQSMADQLNQDIRNFLDRIRSTYSTVMAA